MSHPSSAVGNEPSPAYMTDMTDISPEAAARRDSSRVRGRFGEQAHTDPEVQLLAPGAVDEHIEQTLTAKSSYEPAATRSLSPGDVVLTATNTDRSPFAFALNRSRELRRRWAVAGMPQTLTVTGRRRAPEDGHTDDEVTFDLAGEPLVLTFHRDATFTAIR